MKHTLFVTTLLLLCTAYSLQAQTPNRITLKATVTDTAGREMMGFSPVMLLNPKDSSLVTFTRTDEQGKFEFKNLRNVSYLLKVSYIGYFPLQLHLRPATTEVHDLGTLRLKPISKELMEVVIKTAKAPLNIRGDTVEYDPSAFKVPPGSTVEDLLRRLPGIELDADGNIKAQGRDVKRVYVDGKTFFGSDPKMATRNLDAATLSKVQVYDEKSEQAKLTGIDDGKKEKAMNLQLKDEFKKGSFGKITVAGGTDQRWATRGNYNRFDKKQQFSIIGFGNNINETGVNWEDYSEFKGQSLFRDRDNGDFGFGSAARFFIIGGTDGGLNNYFDGRGFTKNGGGGLNYNYDHKKTKFNTSYSYNQVDLRLDQRGFQQNFLPNGTFYNTDTSGLDNFIGNHNMGGRLEHNIDSNNVLIVKAEGRIALKESFSLNNQLFSVSTQILPINALQLRNGDDQNTFSGSATAIFRHKFHKRGRSFAVSTGYSNGTVEKIENLASTNRFFAQESLREVRQRNDGYTRTNEYRASALYTEPLRGKWFYEVFANWRQSGNTSDRQVYNTLEGERRVDSLSRYFDNQVSYRRIGNLLRYAKDGLNLSGGVAWQQIGLQSDYAIAQGLPALGPSLTRTFNSVVPDINVSYEFSDHLNADVAYSYKITPPAFTALQPLPNVNNPAFRTEGNPNLVPERAHDLDMRVYYWNSANFSNLGANFTYSFLENPVAYNQYTQFIENVGVRTTTRPENMDKGRNISFYMWAGFPIIKTKLTFNMNVNGQMRRLPSFVNDALNETHDNDYNINPRFSLTLSKKLITDANFRLGLRTVSYSLSSGQNQRIWNQGGGGSVRWQVIDKLFFESNFRYTAYKNARFNFDQRIPIWNASVRRLFGKKNRVEARLAAFDLLNRRVAINQGASQNFVSQNISETLARYFMLSMSYNVRGYENKLKKDNMMW